MVCSRRVRHALACVVVLGLTSMPQASNATIIFTQSSVDTDINIGDFVQTSSTTGFGIALNVTGNPQMVDFVTDVPFAAPSSGAATIEAASTLFTNVDFSPTDPFAFSVFELNPRIPPSGTTGTFTLTAMDQFGNTFESDPLDPFTLGNGNNRVAAVATDGQLITSLSLNASGALIGDIRQIRVSASAIPEPSSALLLLGAAGLCGAWRFVRRTRTPA